MFGWDLGRVMTAAVERRGEGSTAAHQRIEYAKLAMTMLGYTVSVYCVWKTGQYMNQLLGMREETDYVQIKKDLATRLGRPEVETMEMNAYEAKLAVCVVASGEIKESFGDIGGMDSELETVMESIVYPIQMHILSKSTGASCIQCPTGVLLYGRPGTGKTLTAKAIAKETSVTFINIKSSNLFDKYIGESEKIVSAMFSLARKLAPSVIFIDEIDTILFNRGNSSSHSSYSSTLGLFLSEWDGLTSSPSSAPVVVLGATNRPQDIDDAFRRRMPVSIETKAPSLSGRVDILEKMLSSELLDESVSVHEVAVRSEGFTGSDLKELVRSANTVRAKETIEAFKAHNRAASGKTHGSGPAFKMSVRAMCMTDFYGALAKMQAAGAVISEFENTSEASGKKGSLSMLDVMNVMRSLYGGSKTEEEDDGADGI